MAAATLLLTGASGFLGQRLRPRLAQHWRVVATSRGAAGADAIALDLADPTSITRAIESVRPAAVVHAGGIADPDACEREPELARCVNVEAVRVLAGLCAQARVRLVHFSTDYVFDGDKSWYREDDAARPLSVYGRGKLASEDAVLSLCPDAAVLRVTNCYGRRMGERTCFVDHWQASLAAGRPIPGFTDQWRSSTAGDQLPEVVGRLVERRELRGVYHWGGADRTTRYKAAHIYCRVMGYDQGLVREARASDVNFAARRPRDSSLDSARLSSALGLAPLGLQQGFAALKAARN